MGKLRCCLHGQILTMPFLPQHIIILAKHEHRKIVRFDVESSNIQEPTPNKHLEEVC